MNQIEELLLAAKNELVAGNKKNATSLIVNALSMDINDERPWQLLYDLLGSTMPMDAFKVAVKNKLNLKNNDAPIPSIQSNSQIYAKTFDSGINPPKIENANSAEEKFCAKCGKSPLSGEAQFCAYCGSRFELGVKPEKITEPTPLPPSQHVERQIQPPVHNIQSNSYPNSNLRKKSKTNLLLVFGGVLATGFVLLGIVFVAKIFFQDPLVGKWRSEDGQILIEFRKDGSLTYDIAGISVNGNYIKKGDTLTLVDDGNNYGKEMPFSIDKGVLILDNVTYILRDKPTFQLIQTKPSYLPEGITPGLWEINYGGRGWDGIMIFRNQPNCYINNTYDGVENKKCSLIDENTLQITGADPNWNISETFNIFFEGIDGDIVKAKLETDSGQFMELEYRKIIDDTSTGNLEKDIQGVWCPYRSIYNIKEYFNADGTYMTAGDGIPEEYLTKGSYSVHGDQIFFVVDGNSGIGKFMGPNYTLTVQADLGSVMYMYDENFEAKLTTRCE